MSHEIPSEKRKICLNAALKCFGTAYIFEKRASKIRLRLTILAFLGIAGPVSVGAIYGTYNLSTENLHLVWDIAGTIAIIQLILTVWSVVSGWNRDIAYYLESKSANYRLANQYEILGKTTILSGHDFEAEFRLLEREAELRANLDNQYDINDKEKRMGMCCGLRQYQRPCAGCNKVPTTIKSTNCDICGNF